MAYFGSNSNAELQAGMTPTPVTGHANPFSHTLGDIADDADQGLGATNARWNDQVGQVATTARSVLAPYAFSSNASPNGTSGTNWVQGFGSLSAAATRKTRRASTATWPCDGRATPAPKLIEMTVEIPLSSKKYPGLVALVDDHDADLVAGHSWYPAKIDKTFYAQANAAGRTVLMHRLVRPDVTGQIDHADRDGLNNTRANLRPATHAQQQANKAPRKDSTSGYKGVCWDAGHGKWRPEIRADGKNHVLGLYDDPVEAAMVRDYVARQVQGEFAYLNFPYSMST